MAFQKNLNKETSAKSWFAILSVANGIEYNRIYQ